MKLRYNDPLVANAICAFVVFCTVGMFSSVSNLGAGGTQSITLSNISNAVLYAFFAFSGLFSGAVNNVLGLRVTLFIGSLGYALYLASLWVYQEKSVDWFLVFSGGVLGICAAFLWTAQGVVMLSYPEEKHKGRAFSTFWVIFNCGSLMGSLIALGINLKQGGLDAVKTSTYIAFFAIIMVGVALTWAVPPPQRIVRGDGTLVQVQKANGPKQEALALFRTLRDKRILLLLPMFFASNFFYTYQGSFAFKVFDAPARSVNAVIKSVGQIIGAIIIGFLVDKLPMKRRNRGIVGLAVTAVTIIISYSWGIKYQRPITRATVWPHKINYSDSAFAEPISILILYDLGDAFYQGMAYFVMGAITNDPYELARFAGLYKAVQSFGSAIAFVLDAVQISYMSEIGTVFGLLLFSMPFTLYVIMGIEDTNYEKEGVVYAEDLKNPVPALESGVEAGNPHMERQPSDLSEKKM
ncbi:MFS general substrate transporter [Testicularia cyperi]|uniref:MFS general substrate transporter n=1 Tax=Testicularia cyperi TaxID=1882483 RepID=A0A317Y1U2_9BASI|nr:MFS general substrate transporter [Testicularia cyperi]